MNHKKKEQEEHSINHPHDTDFDEYSEMELLEMLESLREDMEELGVTTLQEIIARIEELHQRLDER